MSSSDSLSFDVWCLPVRRNQADMMRILLAERVGFEPTIPLRVYHLSRVASSTAPAPLRKLTISLSVLWKLFVQPRSTCTALQKCFSFSARGQVLIFLRVNRNPWDTPFCEAILPVVVVLQGGWPFLSQRLMSLLAQTTPAGV